MTGGGVGLNLEVDNATSVGAATGTVGSTGIRGSPYRPIAVMRCVGFRIRCVRCPPSDPWGASTRIVHFAEISSYVGFPIISVDVQTVRSFVSTYCSSQLASLSLDVNLGQLLGNG